MLNGLYLASARFSQGLEDVTGSKYDSNVPGKDALADLIRTIRTWSLVAIVIAIIIAAILWAWGSQSQNAAQATQGKKGIIVAVAAAAVIIAAEALVQWGMDLGGTFTVS